jgi:hypothetical protein
MIEFYTAESVDHQPTYLLSQACVKGAERVAFSEKH